MQTMVRQPACRECPLLNADALSLAPLCAHRNVGLGDGGTQRLPRLIGMSRAMDLIITGRVIDAKTAEHYGLVSEIVPKGTSRERALKLAADIAKLPQSVSIPLNTATVQSSRPQCQMLIMIALLLCFGIDDAGDADRHESGAPRLRPAPARRA